MKRFQRAWIDAPLYVAPIQRVSMNGPQLFKFTRERNCMHIAMYLYDPVFAEEEKVDLSTVFKVRAYSLKPQSLSRPSKK